MPNRPACRVIVAACIVVPLALSAQIPARDPSAQRPAPTGTAVLSGVVVAADTGRPLKRVRVVASGSAQLSTRLTGADMAGGAQADLMDRMRALGQRGAGPAQLRGALRLVRSTQTDDQGRYELREMPAGKYTVVASKTGFVDVTFGQRRPLRPGTPIELADGQEIRNVSFSLPRGSVVTGTVLDEDGEPLARAGVTVMRYQYQNGQRELVRAGTDQTDDRGMYRVYGLPPGDYYVSAVSRLLVGPLDRFMQASAPSTGEDVLGYAPTFYPGVTTPSSATRVSVGLGQEMGGVDFQLQLVPMARVSGVVLDADGSALSGGNVILVSDYAESVASVARMTGRVGMDGTFRIDNVPPGRYLLWARSRPAGRAQLGDSREVTYAVHTLVVGGQNIEQLVVPLLPGATVSGSVSFDSSTAEPPADLSRFRITMPAIDPIPFGGSQTARVDEEGRFLLTGVPAGRRVIRAQNVPAPWSLKAVALDGRDVTDELIEVRNGQAITFVDVVFTDRVATIAGTVTTDRDQPAFGYTAILFSTDQTTWRAQSRTILATQPDQTGAYQFRGMPPGAYYLVAVDDVEQGEWFDPVFLEEMRPGALRVTIAEGGAVAQDLTVRQ